MSPERLLGQPIDARSDVFSFGVVLYEMVTGTRPFQGANGIEVIDATLHKRPAPISRLTSSISRAMAQLVDKCLEKEPEHRYQSVKELLTDLGQMSGHAPEALTTRRTQARHHNLPLQVTQFIGRERQIEEIQKIVHETKLLTLTGIGGCGKTRLSLQVAFGLLQHSATECGWCSWHRSPIQNRSTRGGLRSGRPR